MAKDWPSRLKDDLRAALTQGAVRTPERSASGEAWLLRWALVCALVGSTLLLFCGYHAGFARVNGLAAQTPAWIWQWLTVLGDEQVAFALTLFFSRNCPRVFWTLVLAVLIGFAYTHSLKPLFAAPRPLGVLEPDTFHLIGPGLRAGSFPSGHSVTAAVFFGVWVYYGRSSWTRGLLILLAVAVGLSRVGVGVHWPLDVTAGLLGGALAVLPGAALARRTAWGIVSPQVHLALLALAALVTSTLFFSDGGYEAAETLQRLLAVSALGYAAWCYLIAPLTRRA